MDNFTLNCPLLITLFQIPLPLLHTSPWINIMWFRLEVCTVARRGWFAPDTSPFGIMLFLSIKCLMVCIVANRGEVTRNLKPNFVEIPGIASKRQVVSLIAFLA
jgi:hypothetical protein